MGEPDRLQRHTIRPNAATPSRIRRDHIQRCGEAEVSGAAPRPPSEPVATDEEQEVQRKNECPPGTS